MIKNFKYKIISLLLSAFLFLFLSCATVPVTGRNQISFIPDSTVMSMSLQEYSKFLKEHELSKNSADTAMVKKVGDKIAKAVTRYFAEKNMNHLLRDYSWEFNLVKDETKNAWCMPGGKVVVYEGIMPIAKTEQGLAVIMGHEIAHAVAKHGNERMSQGLIVQAGSAALSVATKDQSVGKKQLFMTAFGVGAQLGFMLPYSRIHEKEADYLGLVFMTMAGYDPHEAISFWERMLKSSDKNNTPEFLSTHPCEEIRISDIKKAIPYILNRYGK